METPHEVKPPPTFPWLVLNNQQVIAKINSLRLSDKHYWKQPPAIQAREWTATGTSKFKVIFIPNAVDNPPEWATEGGGGLGEPATYVSGY